MEPEISDWPVIPRAVAQIRFESKRITARCLGRAVSEAGELLNLSPSMHAAMHRLDQTAAGIIGPVPAGDRPLVTFNDTHSHADVIGLMDRTIEGMIGT